MITVRLFVRCLVAGLLLGCGGSSDGGDDGGGPTTPPVPPPTSPPASPPRVVGSLQFISSNSRTGVVGSTVDDSLRIRVLDQHGQPFAGVDVEFQIVAGNGALSPAKTITTSDGTAAASWTLGTVAAEQNVVARVAGLPAVSFTAQVSPGTAANIEVVPGAASVQVAQSLSLSATVSDTFGNVIASAPVVWSSGNTSIATVSGAGVVVGIAAGTTRIDAVSGTAKASTTLLVTTQPAVVASVAITPDTATLNVGASTLFAAQLRDASGNILSAREVQWSSANPSVASVSADGRITAVGVGTTTISATAESRAGFAQVTVRQLVAQTSALQRIAAGEEHTCALAASGAASCWGVNWAGQLGDGTSGAGRTVPRSVSGGHLFHSISLGALHSCALKSNGQIFCWGNNEYGQLGNGTSNSSNTPVLAVTPAGVTFTSVSAGWYHTCATTTQGASYCWGSNLAGELGSGFTTNQCANATTTIACSLLPVPVAGGLQFTLLTAGYLFTCGLTAGGDGFCWGLNSSGNLGNGTQQQAATPTRISGNRKFVSLSAGAFHTCGVSNVGEAFCWGLADQGQLGSGSQGTVTCTGDAVTFGCARAPVSIASGNKRFVRIAAGNYHSCAIEETAAGSCWGLNQGGQLGVAPSSAETCPTSTGMLPCRRSPVAVSGGLQLIEVVAGGYHTGARTASGFFTWGANWTGQLGDGANVDRSFPVRVVF